MKLINNDEISLEAWKSLIEVSPFASPFQTPDFYKLFNSVEGFSAKVIAVADEEKLQALVVITLQKEPGIKGFFSRRGIIYGGPLIKNGYSNALELLLKEMQRPLLKEVIYLETRNFFDFSPFKEIFLNLGWNYTPYLNYQLQTKERDFMLQNVSDSRMRQIRKAMKSGVTWSEATKIEEVDVFYNILSTLYKTKIRKPLLPLGFFQTFFTHQIGKFLLVNFQGKIIGGIMCPVTEGKAIYEFYICGLDQDFKEQYPSVMATWAAMEYANQHQIPMFDFMGAGIPGKEYGVREFKARFGGELVEHGRFIKVLNPFLYGLGQAVLKVLAKLPK